MSTSVYNDQYWIDLCKSIIDSLEEYKASTWVQAINREMESLKKAASGLVCCLGTAASRRAMMFTPMLRQALGVCDGNDFLFFST